MEILKKMKFYIVKIFFLTSFQFTSFCFSLFVLSKLSQQQTQIILATNSKIENYSLLGLKIYDKKPNKMINRYIVFLYVLNFLKI